MLTRRTWTCKDSNGCEFVATSYGDSSKYVSKENAIVRGEFHYSAFDGKITANTLEELKQKVANM